MALAAGKSDGVTDFGDPALAASIGWKHRDGELFRAWSLYTSLFIPVGSYELGRIANIGANRWGLDLGTASTMGNFKKGREFSGVLGVTLNGENPDTDYSSGTELHLELTYKQHLPMGLSAGIEGQGRQGPARQGQRPRLTLSSTGAEQSPCMTTPSLAVTADDRAAA